MIRTKQVLLMAACTILSFSESAHGGPTSSEVVERARATYRSLENYSDTGVVTVKYEVNGTQNPGVRVEFKIKLKKPGQYSISWVQSGGNMLDQTFSLWRLGERPHLAIGDEVQWFEGDEQATFATAGISYGIAQVVPGLFFDRESAELNIFRDSILVADLPLSEVIDGEKCFEIVVQSATFGRVSVYIREKDYLVRRVVRTIDNRSNIEVVEPSDEELKEALREAGLEINQSNLSKLRSILKKDEAEMSIQTMVITEDHCGQDSAAWDSDAVKKTVRALEDIATQWDLED